MKKQPEFRYFSSRGISISWHRLNIAMAKECRIKGYTREAAHYLKMAAYERTGVQYFLPTGKEPF